MFYVVSEEGLGRLWKYAIQNCIGRIRCHKKKIRPVARPSRFVAFDREIDDSTNKLLDALF